MRYLQKLNLAALLSVGLYLGASCAHYQEGRVVPPTRESQNEQGNLECIYERDVNRDGIPDLEVEVYSPQKELIEYRLDLDQDGVLDQHWTKEKGLIVGKWHT